MKTKSKYYCDVCGNEIINPDYWMVTLQATAVDYHYDDESIDICHNYHIHKNKCWDKVISNFKKVKI